MCFYLISCLGRQKVFLHFARWWKPYISTIYDATFSRKGAFDARIISYNFKGVIILLPELSNGLATYAIASSIALLVALLYNYFRLDKLDLSFKEFITTGVSCAFFAVILAKVTFTIGYIPVVGFSLHNLLYYTLNGGIVFYGGLIGVIIGLLVMSHILHKNSAYLLDEISISFPLFHSIARIGCLLGGCCYGIPWAWGVRMVESPDIIRFPVQIAESICNLGIFVLLTIRAKKMGNRTGSFRLYMGLYAICRFILEFFRGDPDRGVWSLGLSTSQLIALSILIIIGIRIMMKRKQFMKKQPY